MTKFNEFVEQVAAPLWEEAERLRPTTPRYLVRVISGDGKRLTLFLTSCQEYWVEPMYVQVEDDLFVGRPPKVVRRLRSIRAVTVELPAPVAEVGDECTPCFLDEVEDFIKERTANCEHWLRASVRMLG